MKPSRACWAASCFRRTTAWANASKSSRPGADVFYDLRHRTIYELLVEMYDQKEAIDLITVQQRLKDQQQLEAVGGLAYLASLPDAVPSAANLAYYVDIVREKYSCAG